MIGVKSVASPKYTGVACEGVSAMLGAAYITAEFSETALTKTASEPTGTWTQYKPERGIWAMISPLLVWTKLVTPAALSAVGGTIIKTWPGKARVVTDCPD